MDNLRELRISYYTAKVIEEAVFSASDDYERIYDEACEAYNEACKVYNSDAATYVAYNEACEAYNEACEVYEAHECAIRIVDGNTCKAAYEHDKAYDKAEKAELNRQGNFND